MGSVPISDLHTGARRTPCLTPLRWSSASSRRTPTATARRPSPGRSRPRARRWWRAPTSRRPSRCARRGVRCRILVFGALSLSALDGIFDYDLVPTHLDAEGRPRSARAAAARAACASRYHLKIDTGMNRLGFRHDNLRRTIPPLLAEPEPATSRAVYTHFATADDAGRRAVRRAARATSRPRAATLSELGVGPHLVHAANSAALLADESVWFDMVRPGLLLYGAAPPSLAGRIAAQAGDEPPQPRRGGEGRAHRARRSATAHGFARSARRR